MISQLFIFRQSFDFQKIFIVYRYISIDFQCYDVYDSARKGGLTIMKISHTFSTLLSQVATAIAGCGIVIIAFFLPRLLRFYSGWHESPFALTLAVLYGILCFGALAVAST